MKLRICVFLLVFLLAACSPSYTPSSEHYDQATSTPEFVRSGNMPSPDALIHLEGAPPGVGGPDGGFPSPYYEAARNSINGQGFGVVYAPNNMGGPGQFLLSVEKGNLCFAPTPDHLFAPYLGAEAQLLPQFDMQTAWGIIPFGRMENGKMVIYEQVITNFRFPEQFSSADYNCVMGYALEGNPRGIIPGSLTALIVDKNNQIAAMMDIGFSIDDVISHDDDGKPVVNGKTLEWEILPHAIDSAAATATSRPEVGDVSLFPTGTEASATFVYNEANFPQLLTDLNAHINADPAYAAAVAKYAAGRKGTCGSVGDIQPVSRNNYKFRTFAYTGMRA